MILCQSEFSRATFVERGVPAAKVAAHKNGTDVARFRPRRRRGRSASP